jgi:hypothetical protein
MDLKIFPVHWLLAVTMFFVLNWIGKLAQTSGYLALDIYLKRDDAPAFNFVFRVIGPVVFVVLAACLLYIVGLDQFVQNIWLVIVYQFLFRLLFNLSFGRYLLLNLRREALLWVVSIGLGWFLYEHVIINKDYLFPDYKHISNHLWVLVTLFLYSTLNHLRFDEEKSKRRKNQYLYSAYGDNKHQYDNIISKITQNRLVESIIYSILIYEGFNRPRMARIVEYLFFPWGSKTLGPMQIKTKHRISDLEGVRLGAIRVADAYQDALKTGSEKAKAKNKEFNPTTNQSHRLYVILRVAAAYNKDDTYATEIENVHAILSKEFYKEFAPPKPPRRSDYLI